MMRHATVLTPFRAILSVVLLLFLCSNARADEPTAKDEPRRAAEIIAHIEKPKPQQSWLEMHLGVRKGAGIEYRHKLSVGRRDLIFSVYGPAMKKKRLGLGFEIRF